MGTGTRLITQFNNLGKTINNIENGRIDQVKRIFLEESRSMLAEFRAVQNAAKHIPTKAVPKKNYRNMSKNERTLAYIVRAIAGERLIHAKAEAKQFAEDRAGGAPLFVRGKPWVNRTFMAARGVHAYIEHDNESIAAGLYHTMWYGAYLEYAFNRKYAALEPIVRGRAPSIMLKLKNLFEGN